MKIENFSMESYKSVIDLWKKAGISVGSSDSKEEIEKMLKRNPNLLLIGKLNEKVIAVVMGGFDGRRGYIHHLAVDPMHQKRGHGKKIMEELINNFRKMGVHKIHLFIQRDNQEVVNFYKNLDWQVRDDLIMMSFVPDENLYKMRI
ncbi:MAG: GNAT family N-acetyltransferase [Candidatus Hermodarchaeota archaeon]